MSGWREELMKYGRQAYEKGEKLEFSVKKRAGRRDWRIELKKVYEHGEDEFFEED